MRRRVWAVVSVALVLGSGCSAGSAASSDEGLLKVVTTVSPITNIAQNIGGTKIELTGIVPEGTNSHTFEPAPSDARAFADADVVFINGLHLEEPTKELAQANVREGVPIVELGTTTIPEDRYIYDFSFPQADGDPNPHLWTDPVYAGDYAQIIADELTALDPENGDFYRETSGHSRRRSTS